MRWAILLALCCCSTGSAEDVIKIRLSEIWADRMPGTMNIYELERPPTDYPLMTEITKEHRFKTWQDKAGPAFVVEGIGLDALKAAHAVISGKKRRQSSLSGEISIIFFALTGPQYVHLTKVERHGDTIKVKYEFVPHSEKHLTRHIAIIPLGTLPEGRYKVDIVAEPFAQRFVDQGMVEIPDHRKLPRVSSSFEFLVK